MNQITNRENAYKAFDHAEKRAQGYEFTIDYNGNWYTHGGDNPGPIRRQALARLFGGAGKGFMAGKGLMVDEDGVYWLKSPESQYKVDVEDVPFLIVRYEVMDCEKDKVIDLYTNFDEKIRLGQVNPLEMRPEPINNVDVFYVEVRAGLYARFSKSVYEDFIQHHLSEDADGYFVKSDGYCSRVSVS